MHSTPVPGSPSLPATGVAPTGPRSRAPDVRRILRSLLLGVAVLYALFVASGYGWLHFVIKNERATVADVALFRWRRLRRTMAAEQFAAGRRAWDEGNVQAAYLALASGVRNDPDNVDGRLLAASFLGSAGALNLEISLLQDGLRRAPDEPRLLERTLEVLTGSGRDQQALELIHQRAAAGRPGANGVVLRTYELLAVLDTAGAAAASALLEKSPELRRSDPAAPVVARVLWEDRQRSAAIELLNAYLAAHPDAFSAYVQLAQWQAAIGLASDGVRTAEQACRQFPKDAGPRVLQIQMLAASQTTGSEAWGRAVEAYLREFGRNAEAVTLLAATAGREGWVPLARALLLGETTRLPNVAVLALAYGNALKQTGQLAAAERVYAQLEAQMEEGSPAFLRALRSRQIEAAAARQDAEAVRAYAQRLAGLCRTDPDALEGFRRHFRQLGVTVAVAELADSGRGAPARR